MANAVERDERMAPRAKGNGKASRRARQARSAQMSGTPGEPNTSTIATVSTAGLSAQTIEKLTHMSPRARAFLARMEANPAVREAMRDLADK
jgi:hypothetical protein